jgi:hypothetical protein
MSIFSCKQGGQAELIFKSILSFAGDKTDPTIAVMSSNGRIPILNQFENGWSPCRGK